jgi:ribosome-associated protein
MVPKNAAYHICHALDEKMAKAIQLMDVTAQTSVTDFFLLASATSSTHLKSLRDAAESAAKEIGLHPYRLGDRNSSNWVLLDFGDIVVHLFLQDTRDFYALERLWSDAVFLDYNDLK